MSLQAGNEAKNGDIGGRQGQTLGQKPQIAGKQPRYLGLEHLDFLLACQK